MNAAAKRLDSIYCTRYLRQIDLSSCTLIVYDHQGRRSGSHSSEQELQDFADFMEKAKLTQYSVDVKNPLHLYDCWSDDPIGSGALELFKENKNLSVSDKKELSDLFHPFHDVIYPVHIQKFASRNYLKDINKRRDKDELFHSELEKRKERSKSIGESWFQALPQETVWTDLTLKLRTWALKKKYDAFSYCNTSEDNGDNSYVTLKGASQIQEHKKFKFNKDLYLKTVGPKFNDHIRSFPTNKSGHSMITGLHWAGFKPTLFWEP